VKLGSARIRSLRIVQFPRFPSEFLSGEAEDEEALRYQQTARRKSTSLIPKNPGSAFRPAPSDHEARWSIPSRGGLAYVHAQEAAALEAVEDAAAEAAILVARRCGRQVGGDRRDDRDGAIERIQSRAAVTV